ncbi:MAG TPA: hypothetical protein ENN25_03640 [Euryarchaeota archaeon]|nr:hypothetical protein [Euryarchaeota archaeon]
MPRTNEVRKECPSCGLGVPLDSKICEFCGWDFEEEDEWILQIEKLEQELMLEKQKFEDTSVDKMIESTLRKPQREPKPKEKREAERPSTPQLRSGSKQAPPQSIEEIEAELGLVEISEPDEVISLDLEGFEPPPPDEVSAAEGPEIVKERPDKPTPAPPGKKVRRVVSRATIPRPKPTTGSQMKPSLGKVRRVTKPSDQPGQKARIEAPRAKSMVEARSSKERPARQSKERLAEKKFKGLFGNIGGIFSMPEATKTPPKEAEATANRKTPSPGMGRPQTVKPGTAGPSTTQGKKVTRRVTRTVKSDAADVKGGPAKKEGAPPAATIRVFVCPLCKKEVPENAKMCSGCGAEFE